MEDRKPHFDFVALCPATGYGPPLQVLESLEDLDAASARMLVRTPQSGSVD